MKWFRSLLREAGFGHLSAPRFLGLTLFVIMAAALSVVKLSDILGLGLAVFAFGLASIVEGLKQVTAQRARALSRALPEVAESLASAVASGLNLTDALASLGQVGPRQLRDSFALFQKIDESGYPLPQALEWLRLELSNPYADQLVELLLVTHRSGGFGLVANLDRLSAVIRADFATESELSAKQGWVIGTAKLGLASPWLILLFLNQRPEAHAFYASPQGLALLAVGLTACIVAYAAILGLSKLPQSRRVFSGDQ